MFLMVLRVLFVKTKLETKRKENSQYIYLNANFSVRVGINTTKLKVQFPCNDVRFNFV